MAKPTTKDKGVAAQKKPLRGTEQLRETFEAQKSGTDAKKGKTKGILDTTAGKAAGKAVKKIEGILKAPVGNRALKREKIKALSEKTGLGVETILLLIKQHGDKVLDMSAKDVLLLIIR